MKLVMLYIYQIQMKNMKKRIKRTHKSFFDIVTEVSECPEGFYVFVKFSETQNGLKEMWCYKAEELSLAKELKDMTLEEMSNRFKVRILAEYL